MAVSDAYSSLTVPIDVKLGGVLLANMLAGWLEGNSNFSVTEEAADEPEDYGTPPEQTCLHLSAPVNAGASAPSSGEHGTPVCPAREGAGTGLERASDPHSRPGSGDVRSTSDGAGRLQDPRSGGLDGSGGRGVCIGGVATGALEFRLASIVGVVRAHRNAGDRRRWLLRSGGFQRRIVARIGAMAQAELHFLHARLQGGKLNKAKKGELRFPVPVGLCYDEQGHIILDPDEEVQGAVSLVFRLFRETGSAFGVMQRFAESALRFPKRSYGGAWDGKIIWGRLTHSRVLGMLKNPSYAGMYVFGRYQYRRQISPEGGVQKRIQAVAMSDWRVSLKEHHEGYITLKEFFQNQERLEKNRTNGEETLLAGPARDGLALLQGLLLCGTCGIPRVMSGL